METLASKPELEKPARALTCISICVCTFKRPEYLNALLEALSRQRTDGKFSYSIMVVDNDANQSGRQTVECLSRGHATQVQYAVEPEQSIALARNRTVANASGDLVAFIDDDEVPPDDWLLKMFQTLEAYKVDGVLGPVEPRFTTQPPKWMLKCGAFDRPNGAGFETGRRLHWRQTGTGNVLLRRAALTEVDGPFRAQFGSGGEDIDFFRRSMEQGRVYVWCEEALVHETVPIERTRLKFQLKRALLRGKVALNGPAGSTFGLLKSFAACSLYTLVLPFSWIAGRHVFAKFLIRSCDHLGKLLALCRIDFVRQKYVTK
jgi:succinoglycan biosynthesis protein ExoM